MIGGDQTISQAVILAGGGGKRMLLGRDSATPKPLLEINGVPIIERNIKKLSERGVEICVVINPQDRKIFEKKLGAYEITYNSQSRPLGTANALYCAKGFVREPLFLVMMGDDIADYSVVEMLKMSEPTVFGFKVDDVSGYGSVETDENDTVVDILEKQRSGRGTANTGVYIMPRSFFEVYGEIPRDEKSGGYFLTCVPMLLRKRGVIFRLRKLDYWLGINTPDELRRAEEALKRREDGWGSQ